MAHVLVLVPVDGAGQALLAMQCWAFCSSCLQQLVLLHRCRPAARLAKQLSAQSQQYPYQLCWLLVMPLQHLPLNVDCNAFTAGKGDSTQVRLPDYYPVGGLSKADVHGDMGIIVVALNWPR